MNLGKDYYSVLDIKNDTDLSGVKKAFRKLSKKHHPDVNGGDDSKFKELNEAYSIIGDKKNKPQYDTNSRYGKDFQDDPFGDVFSSPFGGGFNSHFGRQRPINLNIYKEIVISFNDLYSNKNVSVEYDRVVICGTCNGTKKDQSSPTTCKKCKGTGLHQNTYCINCKGSGKVYNSKCKKCSDGTIKKSTKFNLDNIYKLKNGESKVLRGYGNHHNSPGVSSKGDLILQIFIDIPIDIKIDRSGVYHTLNVHYEDMVDGNEIIYETFGDKKLKLKIPECSQDKKVMRMKKQGLLINKTTRSDLFIILNTYIDYDRIKKADD